MICTLGGFLLSLDGFIQWGKTVPLLTHEIGNEMWYYRPSVYMTCKLELQYNELINNYCLPHYPSWAVGR